MSLKVVEDTDKLRTRRKVLQVRGIAESRNKAGV